MRYISIDTETGGIGLDKSLLTLSMIYVEIQGGKPHILERFNLSLIPDDGIYRVTAGALDINKINLVDLAKVAITYKEAGTKVYNKLKSWYVDNNSVMPVPIGKNVYFDLTQIWDKLLSRGAWESFVSYRVLDLSSVVQFMKFAGKMPESVGGSLSSVCEYLNVKVGNLHEAEADALMTLYCLQGFKEFV